MLVLIRALTKAAKCPKQVDKFRDEADVTYFVVNAIYFSRHEQVVWIAEEII